eukprot:scaffold84055_cov45-Attheya_sp.AAC.4
MQQTNNNRSSYSRYTGIDPSLIVDIFLRFAQILRWCHNDVHRDTQHDTVAGKLYRQLSAAPLGGQRKGEEGRGARGELRRLSVLL